MYFVYILKSLKDFKTYAGYAEDVLIRLRQHNSGRVDATRNRRPFEVLYVEQATTLDDAKKREVYWKTGGGRRKLKKYFQSGFPPINLS